MGGHSKEPMTWGSGGLFQNRAFFSLLLMLTTPVFLISMWYICYVKKGSFLAYGQQIWGEGFQTPYAVFPTPFDPTAWKIILSFMAFALITMRFVPGKTFEATVTPSGHVPKYNANGVQCYIINVIAVFALKYFEKDVLGPDVKLGGLVYDNLGKLLSSMNLFAIIFCLFLTIKGLNFPSTKDSGSNGNLIVDFFWGTELYPRILGWDVKQFTNCRFGMMYWQVGLICYAFKQYEDIGKVSESMLVSVLLQSIYIAKFFWWETGYFCSMDIQHDRAGYYICWGCLVWLPSIYTMHTYFLVEHPQELSLPTTILVTIAGIACIWINYDCDRQRQEFRATNGKAKVWGREPDYIVAEYETKDGEKRSSMLLASGWWGLARHFHYIPEILASVFWCVPTQVEYPMPYFYPAYLTLLLADRAWRDDKRCADKYKEHWVKYCEKVPSKIIPGVI